MRVNGIRRHGVPRNLQRGLFLAYGPDGTRKQMEPLRKTERAFPIKSTIEKPEKQEETASFLKKIAKHAAIPLVLAANQFFLHSPWVAGGSAEKAARRVLELNRKKMHAIVCYLGEHLTSREEVEGMVREYLRLIDLLANRGAYGTTIAVRPSSFGTEIPDSDRLEFCWRNLDLLAARCKERGIRICIDMESSEFADYTLELYRNLRDEHGWSRVGTVLQANLRRSAEDLRAIIQDSQAEEHPVLPRLVRGIYREKGPGAIEEYDAIHANFSELIRIAFEESKQGTHIILATHHEGRILEALKLAKAHPDKILEIQMLKGIKPELQEKLRKAGVYVTEYVPYGPNCFPYCVRRMGESPDFFRMTLETGMPKFLKPFIKPKWIMKVYSWYTEHELNTSSSKGSEKDARELDAYLSLK